MRQRGKSQFLSGMMHPIMMVVGNLGYAGVAISGAMLAIRGTITIGDIQAFIQYVKNFTQPIQQIAQVVNQVQSMTAASERVFEFLDEEEEEQTVENPVILKQPQGKVKFDHVRFGYDPQQIIIRDFSGTAEPGQKIAIVGPTGAGKTTIVKLLLRFYDVQGGAISLDGHDIRTFDRSELRKHFGMVLQDTWLFKGALWKISVTDGRRRQMKRSLQRQRRLMPIISSARCPAAIIWSSMKTLRMFRRGRNSC